MREKKIREGGASSIKSIVASFIKKLDDNQQISEDRVLQVWADIVGEQGAKHTKPVTLRHEMLFVVAENPGWIQELTINKRVIVKKLQHALGKEKIKDIKFRTGNTREL